MKKRSPVWVPILIGLFIVIVLSPLLGSWFDAVDDHEIVLYAGKSGRAAPTELISLWKKYCFEDNGRFRPGVFFLKVIETATLGTNPVYWAAGRIFMALISALLIYFSALRFLTVFQSLLLALWILAGSYTAIYLNFGNAEPYGFTVSLVGFYLLFRAISKGRWNLCSLFPGLFFVGLSGLMKESFVPLLPGVLFSLLALPWVWGDKFRVQRFLNDWKDGVALIALLSITAIQVTGILIAIQRYGRFYDTHFSLGFFTWVGLSSLKQYGKTLFFLPWFVTFFQLRASKEQKKFLVVTCLLFFTYLFPQWVIYHGSGMGNVRYLIPGIYFPLFIIGFSFWVSKSIEPIEKSVNMRWLRTSVPALLMFVILQSAYFTFKGAEERTAFTREYEKKILHLSKVSQMYPQVPFLFRLENVKLMELPLAMKRFLDFTLENSPEYILEVRPPDHKLSNWEKMLTRHVYRAGFHDYPGDAKVGPYCIAVDFGYWNTPPSCSLPLQAPKQISR